MYNFSFSLIPRSKHLKDSDVYLFFIHAMKGRKIKRLKKEKKRNICEKAGVELVGWFIFIILSHWRTHTKKVKKNLKTHWLTQITTI